MKVKGYYYKERDQAFMVSDAVFKDIEKAIAHGLPIDTGGKVLYPMFSEPTEDEIRFNKTRIPAWLIRDGHQPALRWYWQVREHKKLDKGCKPLGGGLCGFKMVRFAEWNDDSKKWELLPMVNHADSSQEKVLDSN